MATEPYYTVTEAASLLNRHPETLRRWIREGRLPARRSGRQFRLKLDDIRQTAPASPGNRPVPDALDGMALGSLVELWDNEEDAVYDNWRELYGVDAGPTATPQATSWPIRPRWG